MALTERQLNRAVLARQLLLDRGTMPLPAALEQLAGIQAQYAPAMYVGVWSRLAGFERDALTRALEDRTVIQATLMRSTIHLVSPADYWPFALAVRDARRQSWLRGVPDRPAPDGRRGAHGREAAGDGPVRRTELEELVGKDRARGVGLWHDIVRVPPSGTWERRRADLYGDAAGWLAPEPIEPAAAIEHLVRSYLRGFGPATRHDVASFTGLKLGALKPALAGMERLDGDLLDLPGACGRTPARRRRSASCRSGTRRCSSTPAAPACCPRICARACSASASRTARRRSSSTARSPASGVMRTVGSRSTRGSGSTARRGGSSTTRPSGSPPSTPDRLSHIVVRVELLERERH